MPDGRRVVLALILLLAARPAILAQESAPELMTLRILHTNDIHGQVRPFPATWRREEPPPAAGGWLTLAAAIEEERRRGPALLLDAGDIFQGTPEGIAPKGALMVDLMSAIRYDAVAVGNHDFDLGESCLIDLARRARFPFIAANLVEKDGITVRPYVRSALVLDCGGFRVGVTGVITETSPEVISARIARDLVFDEEAAGLRRGVAELRRLGAEIIVAVNHVGAAENTRHAADIEGLDVIIGGHNHASILRTARTVPPRGTLVAQAASKGSGLGIIEIDVHRTTRRIAGRRGRVREILHDPAARHEASEALIRAAEPVIGAAMDRPIATAARTLRRANRPGEASPLGNWVADVMREAAGADIALHNRTGIRKDMARGPVAPRDIFEIAPFDNTLVSVRLTGAVLRRILERALARSARALEVSGIEITASRNGDGDWTIASVRRNGRDVGDADEFLVVTNSFLAHGGDGYDMFAAGRDLRDTGIVLRDALAGAAKAAGTLDASDEIRWRVAEPAESRN